MSRGKVAIVTGGVSGIGAAVAERLAGDGMTVVAADLSAERTELEPGSGIHPVHVDVTDESQVDSLVAAVVREYGSVDCLVHSAGIGRVAPFLETSAEMFDLVLRTNLYGTFLAGRACARAMRERALRQSLRNSRAGRRARRGRPRGCSRRRGTIESRPAQT